MEHIVSSKVFGSSADGYATLEHLQADIRPFANGLEVDAAVDEDLGEVASSRAEGIGTDGDGTRDFVGFEELDCLFDGEKVEELLGEVIVITVVVADIRNQGFNVFRP